MNICIINVDTRPEFIGGIKRVSSVLANEWRKLGHDVCFMSLCMSDLHLPDIAGIPQFFLPNAIDDSGEDNVMFFTQFIREHHIDVVLNQHLEERGMMSLCAKVRNNIHVKLVASCHFAPTHNLDIVDSCFFPKITLSNRLKRYTFDLALFIRWHLLKRSTAQRSLSSYYAFCLENCDNMVLLSKQFIPIMNALTHHSYQEKIKVINNPLSYTADKEMPVKSKTVVWCGRVGYDAKRVDRMLHIWKRVAVKHPDWNCVIIGSGNIDYFKKAAQKFAIPNVRFLGFCDPKPYYESASIACMTSSAEGWGLVLLEAMAHGCVPMAYNSYASLQDIITDGENGFAIPAFDEDAYVNKLELLMTDANLRNSMAINGLYSVNKYDTQTIANQWIWLFNDALN